ncbi:hypothetical protein [Flavobacterium sp.]|jgi:hypothetical protein|uniref:hypothetical protein n=1 Tax=Flavobacterium sp. TaxID=239 RepID=UPI0037C0AEE9
MRKIILILLLTFLANLSFGQQKIRVHNSGNTMYSKELNAVDSIKLDNTYAKFKLSDATSTLDIQKTLIDSLTFTSSTVNLDKIYIIYNGTDNATIINPYATAGLTITATGGTVVATGTTGIENLEYNILGSSAKEVEANGIELGEMNKKLLQKVEELTLYIIEINKELQEVKSKLKMN